VQRDPARPANTLEVVRASTTCALGRFGGLMLINWRTQVTHADIAAVVTLRDELLKTDSFSGAIHIAEASLPVPEEAVRRAAQRALETGREKAAAIAFVVLGVGFGASAIRSVGTAVFALRRAPTRLFADTDTAVKWIVEEVGAHDDAQALAEACRVLRAASG
jgi:hypothetical protein